MSSNQDSTAQQTASGTPTPSTTVPVNTSSAQASQAAGTQQASQNTTSGDTEAAAAASNDVPQTPELSDDAKKWVDHIMQENGPHRLFQYISDGVTDRAQEALSGGNRKQVLYAMTIGEIADSAAKRAQKAYDRANRTRKGKGGADDGADDSDED